MNHRARTTLNEVLRRTLRALAVAALAAALIPAAADNAWAKPRAEKPEPEGQKLFVVPYALVGLCIAFGVMVACRPGNREDKERISAKEEFEEDE